jgi:hypothetical protein
MFGQPRQPRQLAFDHISPAFDSIFELPKQQQHAISRRYHSRTQQHRPKQQQISAASMTSIRNSQQDRERAATKIQQWYRSHLQARLELRQQVAAQTIQRVIAKCAAINHGRKLLASMRQLHMLALKISDIRRVYTDKLCGRAFGQSRDLLAFEDALVKAILEADCIETYGDETVRAERRRVVQLAQDAQLFAQSLPASAIAIQRWWRSRSKAQPEQSIATYTTPDLLLVLRRAAAHRRTKNGTHQLAKHRQFLQSSSSQCPCSAVNSRLARRQAKQRVKRLAHSWVTVV